MNQTMIMSAQVTRFMDLTTRKKLKRVAVAVMGATVLAIGVALIVLPGPAFLVIPAGLAILAIEFVWAKRWLLKARGWADASRGWLAGKRAPKKPADSIPADPKSRRRKENPFIAARDETGRARDSTKGPEQRSGREPG